MTLVRVISGILGFVVAIVAVPSLIGEGWLGLWLLRTRRFAA